MKNGNRAAHPLPGEVMVDDSYEHSIIDGLTKREHFAGLAMQKCWYELTDGGQWQHFKYAAEKCAGMADALLAELEKGGGDDTNS